MCAKLEESMYGTRDATRNWGYAYTQFMRSIGFEGAKSSPCVFKHTEREVSGVVHGDDFNVFGWNKQLDCF